VNLLPPPPLKQPFIFVNYTETCRYYLVFPKYTYAMHFTLSSDSTEKKMSLPTANICLVILLSVLSWLSAIQHINRMFSVIIILPLTFEGIISTTGKKMNMNFCLVDLQGYGKPKR
jgi:hypothetical protein